MEYVSFLAGERWSDHPACTHPLLAGVARGVNDQISDDARAGLVDLIPSVIGLTGDDPRIDAAIAMRCAAIALPVVAEHRQRALAVGLLVARQVYSDLDEGTGQSMDSSKLFEDAEYALSRAPLAARWARDFTTGNHLAPRAFQRRSAPCMVRVAITGIAEACIRDPDAVLHELLSSVIDDCRSWLGPQSPRPSEVLATAR